MKIFKRLLSFSMAIILINTISTTAHAQVNESTYLTQNYELVALPSSGSSLSLQSAGLAFGPVTIGNLKIYVTNPHTGYIPGLNLSGITHVNFHVDNVDTKKPILNYHIVKYGNNCLYVYDSVSNKEIINNCFNNWSNAATSVVSAAKTTISKMYPEANWIAKAAIWGTVILVIADLILPLDPIPILPTTLPNEQLAE